MACISLPPGTRPDQAPNANAIAEANLVTKCATDNNLFGVLLDAEQNGKHETRYFLGDRDQATAYVSAIQAACSGSGRGLAFSGNDIPQVHGGFPFDIFLAHVTDNCLQLYYTADYLPARRFADSVAGYKPLETARNFQDRYKPVGNITTISDVALPDAQTCVDYFTTFLNCIHAGGYTGYGLWCWDEAPPEIFDFLRKTP